MKKYFLAIIALTFFMSSCNKNLENNEFATDDIVPEGWLTEKQSIHIEGKAYELTVAGDPNGDGIKFLKSPFEVEQFFEDNQETLIPHVVMGQEKTIYYYKNMESFNENVEFVYNDETPTKAYRGATVTAYKHGGTSGSYGYYGYGTAIQDKNSSWQSFWHLPSSSLNGGGAYGKSRPYVGSSMNDEISAINFYMNNADEPITFVGYKNSWSYGNPPYYSSTSHVRNCIVITKLPAAWGNTGQWIGSNTAALWTIRRAPFKTWNDCISGYQFWQNSNLSISNIYVR